MKLLVLAASAAALAEVNSLRIPSFLGGQKTFSSKEIDFEEQSDQPFHEEFTKYYSLPDEFYESLSNIAEEAGDDETPPSLAFDASALGADIKAHVGSIVDEVADTVTEWWYSEDSTLNDDGDDEYVDDLVDDDYDVEDFQEAVRSPDLKDFDFPNLPDGIPHPKLPSRPHFPHRPEPPKDGHPHPPKRPGPHPHPPSHWPGHGRHHPNPHFKHINDTIFEFLANSSHHKILYHLVKNDSSLIDLFNTTGKDGKVTLFAPTDCAFEKILKHRNHTHHAPKWLIRKLIEYHTVDSFYPTGRVLAHRTIPTLFKTHHGPNLTQRIRIGAGLKGVNINFYAHPVFLDIFTSNGVVHAIDNLLIPPPPTYFILKLFPTFFSTFFQAFHQTNVVTEFFPWKKSSSSWTLFVPSNIAWTKIPLGVTAFLFSPRGHRILTKLVEYHISPNTTFYTDSIWTFPHPPHHPAQELDGSELPRKPHWKKQHFNTSLPTLISKNATLRIDEFKFGPFVKIAINGRPGGIVGNDILAFDGVIHGLDRFVLPPRRKCRHGHGHEHGREEEEEEWVEGFAEDEEWTIDNLRRIFDEE